MLQQAHVCEWQARTRAMAALDRTPTNARAARHRLDLPLLARQNAARVARINTRSTATRHARFVCAIACNATMLLMFFDD